MGTGKTHVVHAVQEVMDLFACAHRIRYLAPTGTAAALIGGSTCHKGLSIKVHDPSKGKGNRKPGFSTEDYSVVVSVNSKTELREEWKHVVVLFIDEISLLSLQMLSEIDYSLRYAKGTTR